MSYYYKCNPVLMFYPTCDFESFDLQNIRYIKSETLINYLSFYTQISKKEYLKAQKLSLII